MTFLDIFTFVVLIVIIGAAIILAIVLGALPGKIAKKRKHPQAEAINVCGWLGLLTMGILWPFALIWAYTKPLKVYHNGSDDTVQALKEKVKSLEEQLAQTQEKGKGGGLC